MKKPSKYSIIIIPDNDDSERHFTLSRITMLAALGLLILIILFIIFFIVYALPKMMEVNNLRSENERFTAERVQIMELMQDLKRIEQMDMQIRKTLGPDLQLEPDSTNYSNISSEKNISVSYIENIPSYYPVDGFITQKVSLNNLHKDNKHFGIDIAVKEGDAVYAAASGFVVFSGWTYNFGNYIILYHSDDYFSVYGHNKLNLVDSRDFIQRGDVIASAGGTGISSGPHLHFEVWKGGTAIDPFELFPKYKLKDISVSNYE